MPLSPNGGWPKPTSGPFRRVRVVPSGPQIGPGTLGQTAVAVQDLVELMLFQLTRFACGGLAVGFTAHPTTKLVGSPMDAPAWSWPRLNASVINEISPVAVTSTTSVPCG